MNITIVKIIIKNNNNDNSNVKLLIIKFALPSDIAQGVTHSHADNVETLHYTSYH